MHSSAVQYVVVLQAAGLQMAPQFSMLRHMTKAGAFVVIHTRVYRSGTRALMRYSSVSQHCMTEMQVLLLHPAIRDVSGPVPQACEQMPCFEGQGPKKHPLSVFQLSAKHAGLKSYVKDCRVTSHTACWQHTCQHQGQSARSYLRKLLSRRWWQ